MDKNFNLIISVFISILLYILLIISFLFYIKNDIIKKIDTVNHNTVLQLDIVLENDINKIENDSIKSGVENKKLAQKIVKKTSSSSVKQKSNLKSLFANVKTKAVKINKKRILNVKRTSISSRYKSKFEKEQKAKNVSLSNMIDNTRTNKQINKMVISETNNQSDPYYSKINQILSSRWNPVVFNSDMQAKILITISRDGTFSYKFLSRSDSELFNKQLNEFLKDESFKLYPSNGNNQITNIEILFRTKG